MKTKTKTPHCPSLFNEHRCTLPAGHLYAHHTREGQHGDVSWACDAGRVEPHAPEPVSGGADPMRTELDAIQAYWTKPDPPVFCSACRQEFDPPRSLTSAAGLVPMAPCPHCGSLAGYTFTFTTSGRDAKADILTLLAALSASRAGVDPSTTHGPFCAADCSCGQGNGPTIGEASGCLDFPAGVDPPKDLARAFAEKFPQQDLPADAATVFRENYRALLNEEPPAGVDRQAPQPLASFIAKWRERAKSARTSHDPRDLASAKVWEWCAMELSTISAGVGVAPPPEKADA